ncbi:quinone oxidoreductase [Alcaligenaceae bacterium]|nr:quinone oxidoreductase [Alcaligenaceae bacterium]
MLQPAIVLREAGDADQLRLEDVDVTPPGNGQVQVRHTAIGVNFHDVYVRSGLYKTLPLPGVPGLEAAGVVTAVGPGATRYAPGDRVAYLTRQYGAYATERVIDEDLLVPVPDTISDEVAATHLVKGLTAYALSHDVYAIKPRDRVLVHAAAGGVGSLLCQWAAAKGATVIGTVGSQEKAEAARRNGCEHVILYREEDFVARVAEITHDEGVQVAYDSVGKDTFFGSLACLAPLGHLANFGQASGPVPPFEVSQLFPKANSVSRMSVFVHCRHADIRRQVAERLFAALHDGTLNPGLIQKFSLADAPAAHRALESRERLGSLLLVP